MLAVRGEVAQTQTKMTNLDLQKAFKEEKKISAQLIDRGTGQLTYAFDYVHWLEDCLCSLLPQKQEHEAFLNKIEEIVPTLYGNPLGVTDLANKISKYLHEPYTPHTSP